VLNQVLGVKCDISDEIGVPLVCLRLGNTFSLNRTCLEV
jgi:hypothetical protein